MRHPAMMKRVVVAACACVLLTVPAWGATIDLGTVTVSGGYQAGHFDPIWDLTNSDITVSFTANLTGMQDLAGAHAWSELGIRQVGGSDFNPNAKGVWLATDYDYAAGTFAPDPVGSPTLDMDDKLILQKQSGQGEGAYNLPGVPPTPGNNHRVWWDRDGVDPWQNGETANTAGLYNVVMNFRATSATTGEAFMTINTLAQGFETDGNWSTIELTPAGMTFTGDMTHMQVFYGLYGYGATHSATFADVTVTSDAAPIPAPGAMLLCLLGAGITGLARRVRG